MGHITLFEDAGYANLLPLTYWRCVAELFCGRKSLMDNAASWLGSSISGLWTRPEMAAVAAMRLQTPVNREVGAGDVLVNARWLLNDTVTFNEAPFVATRNGTIVYVSCDAALAKRVAPELLRNERETSRLIEAFPSGEVDAVMLDYPWDLVAHNADALRSHWSGDDRGIDGDVSSAAYLVNHDRIHVSERTVVKPTAVINAENGPVYISNDVLVDAHTYIEGPAYIGPGSVVKPHTSIRAGTTLCSLCKVAGEISGSILAGYTNKQHEGFLGDAYVGSWVNLGAGTTNSNLKNTYGEISVQLGKRTIKTGRQFFGCVIGDFCRLGIGQLLPTGAIVGFGAMCATGGFAPKFVPSFGWITTDRQDVTDASRLLETARTMLARRKCELSAEEVALFRQLPELCQRYGV